MTNAPSNALCRKSGFALLGETDVEFAGHPLHCNHWALELAAPGQPDSGVALQPDGGIVVAGQRTGDDEMAVARLHG